MENKTTYRFAVGVAQGEQREARDRADEILLVRGAIEPSIGEPGARRFFARA